LVSCCGNKNLYHFDLYILPLLEEKDEWEKIWIWLS
jgi:tRNA A37 threonylcarbamoyladenosine biosynthesis protein TsaE